MRALDARLGRWLCRVLTWIRRLAPEPTAAGPFERVLLIKFWGMGSLICATPLAAALRERHPGVRIDLLTFESQRGTAEFTGIADHVLTLDPRDLFSFGVATLRMIGTLRRRRYSAVIDLEFFSKFTAILAYLSGSPRRVGFQFRPIDRGDLLTDPVPFNDRLHVTRIFRSLGRPLGVPDAPAAYPKLAADAEARAEARALRAGGRPRYVAIHANVSEQSAHLRRWPIERYADLARAIAREDGVGVVLVGGPADREYVAELARRLADTPGVEDLSGKLTVAGLAAVLEDAEALVSSDTGPMHLAVAVGTPVVAFFGTETPRLFGPLGERHVVLHRDLPCSPCLTVYNEKIFQCPFDNVCMRSIEMPEVLERVRALLHAAAPGTVRA